MRDGYYVNAHGEKVVQKMVNENDEPKGMKAVLEERGFDTSNLNRETMRVAVCTARLQGTEVLSRGMHTWNCNCSHCASFSGFSLFRCHNKSARCSHKREATATERKVIHIPPDLAFIVFALRASSAKHPWLELLSK